MPAIGIGPQGVTPVTPSSREAVEKYAIITAADTTTGFAAFVLPKFAVPVGVYTLCTGANATQTINVGYTNGGTDLLNAFAPNSTGYAPAGAAAGSQLGVQLTADKIVYVKASVTLTTQVIVKVEFVIPPVGQSL